MEATDGRACMVVSKQDRTEVLVTLQLADLMALLQRAAGHIVTEEHDELDASPASRPE